MDRTASPGFSKNTPPSSSADPRQQAAPNVPSNGDTKNITAHDTVPTSADGTEGTEPRRTDGPKNPDPSSGSGMPGTGTEYNSHMKGTAAPGSHSELFGLSPNEDRVHSPDDNGPGAGSGDSSGHVG